MSALEETEATFQIADWRDELVDAEDVEFAYRGFLGRMAENAGVVANKVGLPRRRLLTSFLTSQEFFDKIGSFADGMLAGVDEAMLLPVDPVILAWLVERFTIVVDLECRGKDRVSLLEVIGTILSMPDMAADFLEQQAPGSLDVRRLGDAIAQAVGAASEVANSSLFQPIFYEEQVRRPMAFPALHYLVNGEAAGLPPGPGFDPAEYRRRHPALADWQGNLLLHYERIGQANGWQAPSFDGRRAHASSVAVVRNSPLFDEAYYRESLGEASVRVGDLAQHYLLEGEAKGLRPSPGFDPVAYAELYPDIANAGMSPLWHYELHGRAEGRLPRSIVDDLDFSTGGIDPNRPTVLLLLHEASHTGAPILGWNLAGELGRFCNVVVVLRAGGTLDEALAGVASAAVGPLPPQAMAHPLQLALFARHLVKVYGPLYAIANSVETRHIAMALRDTGVPIVALVHEFASTNPLTSDGTRSAYFSRCSVIVFPAELVRQSSLEHYREITIQNSYVIPQGPSAVPTFSKITKKPPHRGAYTEHNPRHPLSHLLAGERGDGPFTIVGLGSVELRKGVDLFIAAGTALLARQPALAFQMIWIGNWDRVLGTWYNSFIEEQAKRSGLGDRLHFFAAIDNLEPVYRRADALFLSSRLDPLPNISIDAARRDLPIVCFKDASGMAELLLAESGLAKLVAPHLDTGGVAERLAALATNRDGCAQVGRTIGEFGRRVFDMSAYVRRLDQLGRQAAVKMQREAQEVAIIEGAGVFEADFYLEPGERPLLERKAVSEIYLDRTQQVNFKQPALCGAGVRRPIPGFNPFIYASEARAFPADGSRDPLAHFLEQGRPTGRWMARVIRPAEYAGGGAARRESFSGAVSRLLGRQGSADGPSGASVALHGHFYYTDDIAEFMAAVRANETRMDLFLTTRNEAAAAVLQDATRDYVRGSVQIDIVSNRGRDIAPFLRLLETQISDHYQIVGHVHGKKSLHTQSTHADIGRRWRQFLWANLLGPDCAAADASIAAMRADTKLGLVFPQNDFTVPWDENLEIASNLALKMGIASPLPPHLDFPVGTMFWARTKALQPLLRLRLVESDFPSEPLPNDGTILHALERLLPFVAGRAGFAYAVTCIANVRR